MLSTFGNICPSTDSISLTLSVHRRAPGSGAARRLGAGRQGVDSKPQSSRAAGVAVVVAAVQDGDDERAAVSSGRSDDRLAGAVGVAGLDADGALVAG